MQGSPSWKTKSSSASQEIPHILWSQKVHYNFQKSLPLFPILGHLNPPVQRINTNQIWMNKMTICWDIMICSSIRRYQSFKEIYSLHLQHKRSSAVKVKEASYSQMLVPTYKPTQCHNLFTNHCENHKPLKIKYIWHVIFFRSNIKFQQNLLSDLKRNHGDRWTYFPPLSLNFRCFLQKHRNLHQKNMKNISHTLHPTPTP